MDGHILASDKLSETIREDQAPDQVANVTTLPGIQLASLAMPDIHWGYGFCIGGVCATDPEDGGVISPGGDGYDINCGVRLVKTNLFLDDVKHHIRELVKALFHTIPSGAGRTGRYRYDTTETRRLMGEGPKFVIDRGLGVAQDLKHTETDARIPDGDPHPVSDPAVNLGSEQCGTLCSGHHFPRSSGRGRVLDADVAKVFGLELNQVCVMIHSGSRGLGYQVCDDALSVFRNCPEKYKIELPDRQLACAPVDTPEGRKYIAAMRAAANYGFCNRQLLMHQAREVFAEVFGRSWEDLGMELLYDVAHNIAKLEEHTVEGKKKKVWVHRKGATRAFPAGHPEVPEAFRGVGQPVIIPGEMGRASWVLVGRREHGEDVRLDVPRRAARDEPHGREARRRGPQDRQGTGAARCHRDGDEPQRPRGGAAESLQKRGRRGRCRPRGDLSRGSRMRPIGVIKG